MIEYLSQRNNRLKPDIACNVTAMCMGLIQAGYKELLFKCRDRYNGITNNNFLQPEDALMDYMQQDKYRDIANGDLQDWKKNPEQSFDALIPGVNDFMGLSIFWLNWRCSIEAIRHFLISGYGVVFCGDFPNTNGHFVCISDYRKGNFEIQDPWGDYRDGYTNAVGKDIPMPITDFKKICYGSGANDYWIFLGTPGKI